MRRFATLVIFLALAGTARAEFQKGLDAWNGGDYKTAFEEFKQAAEQGDARAQFYLGEAYNRGRGVLQDYADALTWYRKAAEQNNADAQETLCSMYFFGQGIVPQDYAEGAKMCAGAGKQGRVYPAYLGGYLYEFGKGVNVDLAQAAALYKVAAEGGNTDAQEALGRMYFFGQGVTQDYEEAAKWNRKVAEEGRSFSQFLLAYAYDYGKGVATKSDRGRGLVSQGRRPGRWPRHERARLHVHAGYRRSQG